MNLILEAAGYTDTGRLRGNNEDAFRCLPEQGIFVVCDGMGGAAAGEIASRMATDSVAKLLCETSSEALNTDDAAETAIKQVISQANRKIYERSRREEALQGMGTTVVLALIARGVAHLAHAGDSRCYLWRNGRLMQMTQDHSLVSEQVSLGIMTQAEAEHSPYRNVITRALGTEATVPVDYQRFVVMHGDLLLLCSDGLTREMRDDAIASVVARATEGESLDPVCRMLIEQANEAGGRDNITCVLVRMA